MQYLSKKDLVKYFAEVLVVVLGILIAFQVDEWREGLRERRELDDTLVRLGEETRENARRCANSLPRLVRLVFATQTVHKSLQSGRLDDEDVELFDEGLVTMGVFLNVFVSTSATDEMISTGLLREIDNPELRAAIGSVPDHYRRLSGFTQNFRLENTKLIDELASVVTFTYSGDYMVPGQSEDLMPNFEGDVEVSYDFASLSGNQRLTNLVLEAVDSHRDTWAVNKMLCDLFAEIELHLAVSDFE